MALSPLASPEDLVNWLAPHEYPDNAARVEAVLLAVSDLVRTTAKRTWADEEVPAVVKGVVLQVAGRVLRNPGGLSQQQTGPFSAAFGTNGQSGFALTDEERAIVIEAGQAKKSGLWTQAVTRGDDLADTVWVPTVGGPLFPWLTTDDI